MARKWQNELPGLESSESQEAGSRHGGVQRSPAQQQPQLQPQQPQQQGGYQGPGRGFTPQRGAYGGRGGGRTAPQQYYGGPPGYQQGQGRGGQQYSRGGAARRGAFVGGRETPSAGRQSIKKVFTGKKLFDERMKGTTSATTDDPTILMKTDSKVSELEETFDNISGDGSSPLSQRIREMSHNLRALCEPSPSSIKMPYEIAPETTAMEPSIAKLKNSVVHEYLYFLNHANKEELMNLKCIGEIRATYIMEMRKESPEPFKSLDDLQDIGLSTKQIKGMLKQLARGLF